MAAGSYSRAWDGHDDQGRAVPAGVYFYRVETPDRTVSGRMVLVR